MNLKTYELLICSQVLHKIATTSTNSVFIDNVNQILKDFQKDLISDPLLSSLTDVHTLRPFLDVVLENTLTSKLSVCELEANSSAIYRHVIKQMADQPKLHIKTVVADATLPEGNDFDSLDITPTAWDFSKETTGLGKFHLVVLNNILHRQPNAVSALQKAIELVEDGGFLMVQEVTQNFPIFLMLESLHRELPVQDAENDTAYGCYRTAAAWNNLFGKTGLEVVMQASDDFLSSMFLLRRKVTEVS